MRSLLPLLILIPLVVAYAPALSLRAMMDEKFLRAWASHSHSAFYGANEFWTFSGLMPEDLWGFLTPLSLKITQMTSFNALWLWRIHDLALHGACVGMFYLALQRLFNWRAAFAASMIFAVLPTNVPSVAWVGGRGMVLAGLLIATSLWLYLKARNVDGGIPGELKFPRAAILGVSAAVVFGLALAASASAWVAVLFFVAVEALLWFRSPPEKRNGTYSLVSVMLPFVLAAAVLAAVGRNPLGSYSLYTLMMPACALAGYLLSRVHSSAVVPLVVSGILAIVGIALDWKQIKTMRAKANVAREARPRIATVTQQFALSPMFAPTGPMVFDERDKLIASNRISGGPLKDSRRMDSTPPANQTFTASQVTDMFQPPISFMPTAKLDTATGELVIKSEMPTTGPVLRIRGDWLAPTGADFVWVDAKIDSAAPVASDVNLYWNTFADPSFDLRFRKISTDAFISDGKFHRYYFPLRGASWVTSMQAAHLVFGFPAASTAYIKAMGTADKSERMPEFRLVTNNSSVVAVTPPCFGFPADAGLGLYVLPPNASALTCQFATKDPDAIGVYIELSGPNQDFHNPNGTRLSSVSYHLYPVVAKDGKYDIPVEQFPRSAVYAVRASAFDKGHSMIGNFSDTLYVYVQRPNRMGWSTQ
jgi:hypothetical protein